MKNTTTSTSPRYRQYVATFRALGMALICTCFLSSCQYLDDLDLIEDEVDKHVEKMFEVHLSELNDSGVTGTATIKYTENGNFQVLINASNLSPNRVHAQHIHGFVMEDKDAVCPPPSAAGEDGLLTLQEGLPFYGPVIVPLDDELVPLSAENFPYANQGGNLSYVEMTGTPELISAFNAAYDGTQTEEDLKLIDRVIVIHGAFVKDGMVVPHYSAGVEYDASLPVACGEIMRKY